MQLSILISLLLLACMPNETLSIKIENQITKNDMTVRWSVEGDYLSFRVFAPTDGWVAIGFNENEKLIGTNLIMGCVKGKEVKVEDQYIKSVGLHVPVVSLGGMSSLTQIKGIENEDGTTLQFSIPVKATDRYHHDLREGTSIHLLMAYSREDDFEHHSMMRTSVEIII